MRLLPVGALLVGGAAMVGACASNDVAAPACTDVLPVCPASGAPSYASTVAPLVAATCLNCHAPGGSQSSRSLETYPHLFAQRSAVLNQVHACLMPTADGPQLGEADRQVLETWLVCGAPSN